MYFANFSEKKMKALKTLRERKKTLVQYSTSKNIPYYLNSKSDSSSTNENKTNALEENFKKLNLAAKKINFVN